MNSYRKGDFFITLSRVNTKLRDEYSSLDDLVKVEEIDKNDLLQFFKEHGYFYDLKNNKFREE